MLTLADEDEFILTKHAQERLELRLRTKPRKFLKVCRKAWYSKPIQRHYILKKLQYSKAFRPDGDRIFYRELMGYVFVFDVSPDGEQKRLVTLYK